jgi:hypothetical protein
LLDTGGGSGVTRSTPAPAMAPGLLIVPTPMEKARLLRTAPSSCGRFLCGTRQNSASRRPSPSILSSMPQARSPCQ